MNEYKDRLRISISIGDYNGIGPEIILKSLRDRGITDFFTPVIFACDRLMNFQNKYFKTNIPFHITDSVENIRDGKVNIVRITREPHQVSFGTATQASTQLAIDSLEAATQAVLNKKVHALVTAPIHKDEMLKAGFKHAGHTGYLEEKAGQKGLMILVDQDTKLRVAVATHHIPISQVTNHITPENISSQIKILAQTLQTDYQISRPKIALLGLNPHAGDNGAIGKEEINIILPTLENLRQEGTLAFGPFPADSFFQPSKYSQFDAVLAMYHDQGLTPFKTLCYDTGVNFTAGLPFVRTSPDHGVAFDIAGKGIADALSFSHALHTAAKIYRNRSEYHKLYLNALQPQQPPTYERHTRTQYRNKD